MSPQMRRYLVGTLRWIRWSVAQGLCMKSTATGTLGAEP